MNNYNNDKTILTLQMGDTIQTWSTFAPCDDVPIDDIINAFYSELIGFGYDPKGVLNDFKEFANTHYFINNENN